MSIMVDLPPQMASEIRDYVTADNEELSRMLFNYLKDELARRRANESSGSNPKPVRRRVLGALRGQIQIAEDFDETDPELIALFENSSVFPD